MEHTVAKRFVESRKVDASKKQAGIMTYDDLEQYKSPAKELQREAVVALLREEAKEWKGGADGAKPGDYLLMMDADHLMRIADLLEAKDDQTAFELYTQLDPIVSGALAHSVRNFIELK